MRRFLRFLGSLNHAGMAGAFMLLAIGAVDGGGGRAALLIGGWLAGVVVLGLIRLFHVTPGAYPVAGLLAGPVPFAILMGGKVSGGDWGGIWLLSAILGLFVGVLEWARLRRVESDSARADEGA